MSGAEKVSHARQQEIRALWGKHGGGWHGPIVEHAYAAEDASFWPFIAELDASARAILSSWMLSQGYATGHGDTIEDLLGELGGQIEPFRDGIIKIATFIEPHWLGANSVTDAYDPAKVLKIVVEYVTSLSADTERMDETIARMQADIARKDEALKPFATECEAQDKIRSYRDGDCIVVGSLRTIGDLRRARAALLPKSSPDGEGRV